MASHSSPLPAFLVTSVILTMNSYGEQCQSHSQGTSVRFPRRAVSHDSRDPSEGSV
jgi:hypothetical protein